MGHHTSLTERRCVVLGHPGSVAGGEEEPEAGHEVQNDEQLQEEDDHVGHGDL